MQADEWIKLGLLVAVPLAIAVVVTLWSIKQMAYRPKRPTPRPGGASQRAVGGAVEPEAGRPGHRERPGRGSAEAS